MRHYEIIIITNTQYNNQIQTYIEKYIKTINEHNGFTLKIEDWGIKNFAYPIKKKTKGNYIQLNIQCNKETLDILKNDFQYNNAILRYLITNTSKKNISLTTEK